MKKVSSYTKNRGRRSFSVQPIPLVYRKWIKMAAFDNATYIINNKADDVLLGAEHCILDTTFVCCNVLCLYNIKILMSTFRNTQPPPSPV